MSGVVPARGLYAVVDTVTLEARGVDWRDFTARALAARPAAIQLRAKGASSRDYLAMLRAFAPMCREAGVPGFANDRPDLALLAGCDGFHVGQEDLPLDEARRVAPGLLCGVSTHSEAQLREALALGPSYVAVGPVFPTRSKENPDPVVGLELVRLAAGLARCPVVAIGGIDLERAPQIGEAGALGAVIGALLPPGADVAQVEGRARSLDRALKGFT